MLRDSTSFLPSKMAQRMFYDLIIPTHTEGQRNFERIVLILLFTAFLTRVFNSTSSRLYVVNVSGVSYSDVGDVVRRTWRPDVRHQPITARYIIRRRTIRACSSIKRQSEASTSYVMSNVIRMRS